VDGSIFVESPNQQLEQPINVSLKQEGPTEFPAQAEFSLSPVHLGLAAIVMIIIMACAVLIKKISNTG